MKEMEIKGPSLHPPTGPRSTFPYDETAMLFTALQCLVSTCVVWESVTVCDECGTILYPDTAAHFDGSASITVKQF